MYVRRCLTRRSEIDSLFRKNRNGHSLPTTPLSHGASATRKTSCDLTLKYSCTRKSITFLPMPLSQVLLPAPKCRAVSGRHNRLAGDHLPIYRVVRRLLSVTRSDGERLTWRT